MTQCHPDIQDKNRGLKKNGEGGEEAKLNFLWPDTKHQIAIQSGTFLKQKGNFVCIVIAEKKSATMITAWRILFWNFAHTHTLIHSLTHRQAGPS